MEARTVALVATISLGLPAAAQPPTVSAQARGLYELTRDSVAQIRVLLGRTDSHAATGTGFVVAPGLILTNYHVVADKALEPEIYRLEALFPDGRRSSLRVVAVNVVHDVALLQGDTWQTKPLPFRASALSKGDKGFSLGYPLSQGLTVVEGIYNGRSEEQYYERIHYTGAINSGMSGGPSVDELGRVFGVNVATHRRGQLVSFLVPAKFATHLLSRAPAAVAGEDANFANEVGAQIRAHATELMSALLGKPLPAEDLGEFRVPAKAGDFMQCGAGTQREPNKPFIVDTHHCYTLSSLYIDQRLYTGMVAFRHRVLRSKDLGLLRFAHLQETYFSRGAAGDFDRKHHTRYACRDEIVALRGTRAKIAMCVRRYKRFEGVYDMVVKIATLGDAVVALQSELDMDGVSYEAGVRLAQRYVEVIRWNR